MFDHCYLVLEEVSQTHLLITGVDERVDQQKTCHLCENPKKESQPLCNSTYCSPGSIARDNMNLYYLNPLQRDLLSNGPLKLGLEGPAGTGKTLILLLQIIYNIKAESKFDIILLAPGAHAQQCKNILEFNDVDVQMIDQFPLHPSNAVNRKHPSQPIVRIAELRDFGEKCKNHPHLKPMSMLQEHIFVDDLQTLDDSRRDETLRRLRELSDMRHIEINVWFAYDPVQGFKRNDLHRDLQKHFNGMAFQTLNAVLRNSRPIIEAVDTEYSKQAENFEIEKLVPLRQNGHSINGPAVDCIVLTRSQGISIKQRYLKEILGKIFCDWPNVPTAVLYWDTNELCKSIVKELGKDVIDIKTFYDQGNKLQPSQIVCDSWSEAASFEVPLVVCVTVGYYVGLNYTAWSRARSKLIYIHLDDTLPYENHPINIAEVKKKYPNARFTVKDSSEYDLE